MEINIDKSCNFFSQELEKRYKLTKLEIGFLIDSDLLVKKGKKFKLSSIIAVREFGLCLLREHDIDEAKICFDICYKLAPNNKTICLQYLLFKLKTKNFVGLYEIFVNLRNSCSKEESNMCDLFAHLLSFIEPSFEKNFEATKIALS